ncbi:TetR/AcrR family transcriptional regulator [Pedobacter sp. UBA5917]|jgi:AcrR family transcriptional regulator|uniref:TetR/AcrR family transcriptional regulator n=1 Tax=Pedobacter sp. UBA5917 TaxID=1947061 RepID=UPI0025E816E7|nr:TetR/AcrR family transcriptional regulator [Pedobacter sp. UBA5917]
MQTRERILDTALKLYNQTGINHNTSRHIALEMNISAGNLHYYFKHTEDIVEALYNKMVSEFDILVEGWADKSSAKLRPLNEFSVSIFDLMYRYRFVFINIIEIFRRIPKIKAQHRKLRLDRAAQIKGVFDSLVFSGTLKAQVSDEEWENLIATMFLVSDFYFSFNEITDELGQEQAKQDFCYKFNSVIYAFLNQKNM